MEVVIKITNSKKYGKYKKEVDKIINKLKRKLECYQSQGIGVSKIFNDSDTISDIIHKYFYVYRGRVRNTQVRILYTIENNTIIIYDVYIKNQLNSNVSNEYLQIFENTVNMILKQRY